MIIKRKCRYIIITIIIIITTIIITIIIITTIIIVIVIIIVILIVVVMSRIPPTRPFYSACAIHVWKRPNPLSNRPARNRKFKSFPTATAMWRCSTAVPREDSDWDRPN